jgi:hypothetical protein
VLLLVQCGSQDPTRLFSELDTYARRNQKNADGIEIQIPDKETVWKSLDEYTPGQVKEEVIQRPEFLTEYNERSGKDFPLSLGIRSDAQRFGLLSQETFWPDDQKSRDQRFHGARSDDFRVARGSDSRRLFLLGCIWLGFDGRHFRG